MNPTFCKENVNNHEYQMHKHVYDLNIVNIPKIIKYDENTKTLHMEKIENYNISDMYGENSENVSSDLFSEIRDIIDKLYKKGITYPDITGYNFIESNNKIWIIDFEHSYFTNKNNTDKFVISFIDGLNQWNPEFK